MASFPALILQHTLANLAYWRDLCLTACSLNLHWGSLMDNRDKQLPMLPVPTLLQSQLMPLSWFACGCHYRMQ